MSEKLFACLHYSMSSTSVFQLSFTHAFHHSFPNGEKHFPLWKQWEEGEENGERETKWANLRGHLLRQGVFHHPLIHSSCNQKPIIHPRTSIILANGKNFQKTKRKPDQAQKLEWRPTNSQPFSQVCTMELTKILRFV